MTHFKPIKKEHKWLNEELKEETKEAEVDIIVQEMPDFITQDTCSPPFTSMTVQ